MSTSFYWWISIKIRDRVLTSYVTQNIMIEFIVSFGTVFFKRLFLFFLPTFSRFKIVVTTYL